MKILWLSTKALSERDDGSTGTWLQAMAQKLIGQEQIELGNIAEDQVKDLRRQDYGAIQQWIVPRSLSLGRPGLLPPKSAVAVRELIERFTPDLIQVWGTENHWGLFSRCRD